MQLRTVERMDPGTAEGLARLLIDVVAQGASIGFLHPLAPEAARAYFDGVLTGDAGVRLYVAEEDGKTMGTVQLHPARAANASHRAEVQKLMVHPTSQRRGIARALMSQLEQDAKARGRTLLVLDTRSGDVSADFYRSIGYTEVGRIPRYARSSSGQLDATVLFYREL